jgi:outer membrane protein OmpA-like peptidoglycan-associated protein
VLHAVASEATSERATGHGRAPVSPRAEPVMAPPIAGNQALLRAGAPPRPSPSRMPILQRQCACGGTCADCKEEASNLQTKLAINEPGDEYEREADRVADQVMRMPAPSLQKKAEPRFLQRRASDAATPDGVPPIVGDVLRSPGQPLDAETRAFMEPRFGADFGAVRVHTDAQAAASAAAINAKAYTVGNRVAFGTGQFAPKTGQGCHLLAHELSHVIQQGQLSPDASSSVPTPFVQRLGNLGAVPPGLPCPVASSGAPAATETILFPNGGAALQPLDRSKLENVAVNWAATGTNDPIRVDGFASQRGNDDLNWRLSCDRANAVVTELKNPTSGVPGIPSGSITFFAQGETTEFGAEEQNRRATVAIKSSVVPPTPPPPAPPPPTAGCATPTNADESGRAFNPTTIGETEVALRNPIDALSADSCRDDAFAAAGRSGLPGPHLGPQDAFRHCFASCCLTQAAGASQAEKFGTGHGNSNPSSIPFDDQMDLHDNSIGRGLGVPGADCEVACLDARRNGLLRTIRGPHTRPPASPPVTTDCIGPSDQPWP